MTLENEAQHGTPTSRHNSEKSGATKTSEDSLGLAFSLV
jgi:hypothetical protein